MKNSDKALQRKNGILDTAEALFAEKGYENTTINDILAATGFAKGSLYYYYTSKEDVLDGIIKRRGDRVYETMESVLNDQTCGALEKLLKMLLTMQISDQVQQQLITDLQQAGNAKMFMKTLNDLVIRIAPLFAEAIKQGITEGVFSSEYPLENAEILLAAAHSLFDNAAFNWNMAEKKTRMSAFIIATGRMLGIEASLLSEVFTTFID